MEKKKWREYVTRNSRVVLRREGTTVIEGGFKRKKEDWLYVNEVCMCVPIMSAPPPPISHMFAHLRNGFADFAP